MEVTVRLEAVVVVRVTSHNNSRCNNNLLHHRLDHPYHLTSM